MSQAVDTIIPSPQQPAPEAAPGLRLPWTLTWVSLLCLGAVVSTVLVMGAQGSRGFYLPVLAGLVCLLAGLFDGCTGRIPNPLTYTAILVGLGLNGVVPLLEWMNNHTAVVWLGAAGPLSSLAGFGVCAGLGILGCLAAGMHGGDLKLLAAIGAMLGFMATADVVLVGLAVSLVYALVNLALLGGLNKVVRVGTMRALELLYLRKFETPVEGAQRKASHVPMAVPLGIGLVVAQVWAWRMGGGLI